MNGAMQQAEAVHFTARLVVNHLVVLVDDIKDFFVHNFVAADVDRWKFCTCTSAAKIKVPLSKKQTVPNSISPHVPAAGYPVWQTLVPIFPRANLPAAISTSFSAAGKRRVSQISQKLHAGSPAKAEWRADSKPRRLNPRPVPEKSSFWEF